MMAEFDHSIYSYELPPFYATTLGMLIIAAVVLVGGGALYALIRFLRRERPLSLQQWAMKEAEALSAELAKENVDYKRYFGAVTFFAKQYMQRLYGWQLIDKTDSEVSVFIAQQAEVSKSLRDEIAQLFSYALEVKFADQQALQSNADHAQTVVRQIIDELKPPAEQHERVA